MCVCVCVFIVTFLFCFDHGWYSWSDVDDYFVTTDAFDLSV